MKFHPIIFVLITYGITAVIALCVYLIVRFIALAVRGKEDKSPAPAAGPEGKGGAAA